MSVSIVSNLNKKGGGGVGVKGDDGLNILAQDLFRTKTACSKIRTRGPLIIGTFEKRAR